MQVTQAVEPGVDGELPLAGRLAVVTGGGGGVGRAVALRLAAAGARVCAIGPTVADLRGTAALAGPSSLLLHLQCDLGSVADVHAVVDFVERFDRQVDVVVHAAAVRAVGDVASGDVADLDEQYLVNVRGPFLLTQGLLPRLRGGGHVVFVSAEDRSTGEAGGDRESTQSAVGRYGVRALADGVRAEVAATGVRVTTVHAVGLDPDAVAASVAHAVVIDASVEVSDVQLRVPDPPR